MVKRLLAGFSVSVLLLANCTHKQHPATGSMLFEMEVAEVIATDMPYTRIFTGQTYANNSYVIQPRVTGYLTGKYFINGSKVTQGDLLYQIDPAPFQANVMQAKANLAGANATFKAAESNYNRSVPLARINAISKSALDQAQADYESSMESVKAAKAELDIARMNLGYTKMYAPAGGYIAASSAVVGDYVGGGTKYTQLTTIYSTDSIVVHIFLPVKEFLDIVQTDDSLPMDSLFSNIFLIMPNGSIYPHPGVYSYTEPSVNNQTGAMVIHLTFPNEKGVVQPGTFARVHTGIGKPSRVMLIPQRAVSEVQGITNIYVVNDDSTLVYKPVEIAFPIESYYAVRNGIEPGEKVLVEGLQKARSGMKIKPVLISRDSLGGFNSRKEAK